MLKEPGRWILTVGIGVPVAADDDGRAVGQGRPVAADLLRAAARVAGVGMLGDSRDRAPAVQDQLHTEAGEVVVAVGLTVGVVAAVGGLGTALDVAEARGLPGDALVLVGGVGGVPGDQGAGVAVAALSAHAGVAGREDRSGIGGAGELGGPVDLGQHDDVRLPGGDIAAEVLDILGAAKLVLPAAVLGRGVADVDGEIA